MFAHCSVSLGKPSQASLMRIYVVWGLPGVPRKACESHFGHPQHDLWMHFVCVFMGFLPHEVAMVKLVRANSMRIYGVSAKLAFHTKTHGGHFDAYLRYVRCDCFPLWMISEPFDAYLRHSRMIRHLFWSMLNPLWSSGERDFHAYLRCFATF